MTWQGVLDAADLVTAACAVIGVVLAAVLGWVAINVAKSGNDTARRESLYTKVDDVFGAALELTAASGRTRIGDGGGETIGNLELVRAAEGFRSRLRILIALGLGPEARSATVDAQLFATALAAAAGADRALHAYGRRVFSDTLCAGNDDEYTLALLDRWGGEYNPTYYVPDEGEVTFPRPAFDPSIEVAESLRTSLARSDWTPNAWESFRLFMPWMLLKLGLVQLLDDSQSRLSTTDPKGEEVIAFGPDGEFDGVVEPSWPERPLQDWIDDWTPSKIEAEVRGDTSPEARGDAPFSPEEMSAEFLDALRAEFHTSVIHLVESLRESDDEPAHPGPGWMRRRLGLP